MSRKKKPGNKIEGRPEDSLGQNPFWPGEGNQEAGEFINERGEKVTVPMVDSVAHKKNTKT